MMLERKCTCEGHFLGEVNLFEGSGMLTGGGECVTMCVILKYINHCLGSQVVLCYMHSSPHSCIQQEALICYNCLVIFNILNSTCHVQPK